jgi:hypothetical protein
MLIHSDSMPMGTDQVTRHNPRIGGSISGNGCAGASTAGLLSLSKVARRASMSKRFIRRHLSEIPHYRASAPGKIWIDWIEFRSWVDRLRIDVRQDDCVIGILEEAGRKRSGAA